MFRTLFGIRWELRVVLHALGWEPSVAWGQDAQGDIPGDNTSNCLLSCPHSQSCAGGLWHKSGSTSETFSISIQVTSTYMCGREQVVEHAKRRKKKDNTKSELLQKFCKTTESRETKYSSESQAQTSGVQY